MNEPNIEQNIQRNVLEKIRDSHIRMRPKMYFIARLVVAILATILALALSVFVMSFIFFSIYESGEEFLLGFGSNGILTFLFLFPWVTLLLDIAILFVLEWVLRSFKFGYRISLMTIFAVIFVSSAVLGIIFNFIPVHTSLLTQADRGALPVIGDMYEHIHDSHAGQGVFKGTILSMNGNQIVIAHDDKDHDTDDGTRTVILPSQYPVLTIGDTVYVFGTFSNGVILAHGINKLPQIQ